MILIDNLGLCSPNKLAEYEDKILKAFLMLASSQENGGIPFFYAYLAGKKIRLRDIRTAATNGIEIYLSPNFIEKRTPYQLMVVLAHEAYHMAAMHCVQFSNNPVNATVPPEIARQLLNVTLDIYCDSTVDDAIKHGKYYKEVYVDDNLKVTYDELLDHFSGVSPIDHSGHLSVIDDKVLKRPYTQIYQEIEAAWLQGPQSNLPQKDEHIAGGVLDKAASIADLIRAQQLSKMMGRGNSPGILDKMIDELLRPRINMADYISQQIYRKMSGVGGTITDYGRPRRRYSGGDIFMPRRVSNQLSWAALLDTSGSMSAYKELVISQLQSLPPASRGVIVPCDAEVYWDKITTINDLQDLQFTNCAGGGGTVLNGFFRDYRERLPNDVDILYVLTDGAIDIEEISVYPPHCEVHWVVAENRNFDPPFGKVFHVDLANEAKEAA